MDGCCRDRFAKNSTLGQWKVLFLSLQGAVQAVAANCWGRTILYLEEKFASILMPIYAHGKNGLRLEIYAPMKVFLFGLNCHISFL